MGEKNIRMLGYVFKDVYCSVACSIKNPQTTFITRCAYFILASRKKSRGIVLPHFCKNKVNKQGGKICNFFFFLLTVYSLKDNSLFKMDIS